jgi:pyruvate kinase
MSTQDQINSEQINIVATLGPASDNAETIKALRKEGANIFRLNFSHGTAQTHQRVADTIRAVDAELGTHSFVLADLQGPKIRIGTFENDSIDLQKDMVIRFDSDPAPGNETRVCLPHSDVLDVLKIGSHVLLDDGNVYMEIVDKGTGFVDAKVLNGEKLSGLYQLTNPYSC